MGPAPGLGLCIPLLVALHVASTRLAELSDGVDTSYTYVLLLYWVQAPLLAALQIAALSAVWGHASIGIHFWLRVKRWYPAWRGWLPAVLGLLLPTLALAGFVATGKPTPETRSGQGPGIPGKVACRLQRERGRAGALDRARRPGPCCSPTSALTGLAFTGRSAPAAGCTIGACRRCSPTPSGRKLPILPGASVLEVLREAGIPHASVCGGRARCTTCRVHVSRPGAESLPPPAGLEASRAKAHPGATEGIRLACHRSARAPTSRSRRCSRRTPRQSTVSCAAGWKAASA